VLSVQCISILSIWPIVKNWYNLLWYKNILRGSAWVASCFWT